MTVSRRLLGVLNEFFRCLVTTRRLQRKTAGKNFIPDVKYHLTSADSEYSFTLMIACFNKKSF